MKDYSFIVFGNIYQIKIFKVFAEIHNWYFQEDIRCYSGIEDRYALYFRFQEGYELTDEEVTNLDLGNYHFWCCTSISDEGYEHPEYDLNTKGVEDEVKKIIIELGSKIPELKGLSKDL